MMLTSSLIVLVGRVSLKFDMLCMSILVKKLGAKKMPPHEQIWSATNQLVESIFFSRVYPVGNSLSSLLNPTSHVLHIEIAGRHTYACIPASLCCCTKVQNLCTTHSDKYNNSRRHAGRSSFNIGPWTKWWSSCRTTILGPRRFYDAAIVIIFT